jgi:hypothetical protein
MREGLAALCRRLSEQQLLDGCVLAFAGLGGVALEGDPSAGAAGGRSASENRLRVPLFLRHRASLTGRRIFDEVVELADLAPTLCEWFGIEPPAPSSAGAGRSLLSLTDEWRRRPFPRRPAMVFGQDPTRPCVGLRDDHYRLELDPGLRLDEPEATGGVPRDLAAELPWIVDDLHRRLDETCAALEAQPTPR